MEPKNVIPLPPLVSEFDEVIKNIHIFNEAIAPNAGDGGTKDALKRILPFVQSWYAVRRADGTYLYGPSKFIGYSGISAQIYVKSHANLDGRLTERRLVKWAKPIRNGDPRRVELMRGLSALCVRFLKNPNGRARLALLEQPPQVPAVPVAAGDDEHVKAMLALLARMPPEAQQEIRRLLCP